MRNSFKAGLLALSLGLNNCGDSPVSSVSEIPLEEKIEIAKRQIKSVLKFEDQGIVDLLFDKHFPSIKVGEGPIEIFSYSDNPGDYNYDHVINLYDVLLIADYIDPKPSQDQDLREEMDQYDENGIINWQDLEGVLDNFGKRVNRKPTSVRLFSPNSPEELEGDGKFYVEGEDITFERKDSDDREGDKISYLLIVNNKEYNFPDRESKLRFNSPGFYKASVVAIDEYGASSDEDKIETELFLVHGIDYVPFKFPQSFKEYRLTDKWLEQQLIDEFSELEQLVQLKGAVAGNAFRYSRDNGYIDVVVVEYDYSESASEAYQNSSHKQDLFLVSRYVGFLESIGDNTIESRQELKNHLTEINK